MAKAAKVAKKQPSVAAQIREIVLAHPELSNAEISERVGLPPESNRVSMEKSSMRKKGLLVDGKSRGATAPSVNAHSAPGLREVPTIDDDTISAVQGLIRAAGSADKLLQLLDQIEDAGGIDATRGYAKLALAFSS